MNTPRKAILLAAGYATRMAPLSHRLPKCLLPLWGKPMIEHTITLLEDWGVREILINLHHGAGEMLRHVLARRPSRARIALSFEPEILGTGGALRRAQWFFDEPSIWVANGDVAMDLDPAPLLRRLRADPLAVLWMDATRGPRTVELDGGWVANFHSPTPGAAGTVTFSGLHLAARRILGYLPAEGFCGIVDSYKAAMRAGERIAAVATTDAFWADAGTPEEYLETHAGVRKAFARRAAGARLYAPAFARRARALLGGRARGFFAADPGVVAGKSVAARDSVVCAGAVLHAGARLQRAIVAPGTHVWGAAGGIVLRPDHVGDPGVESAVRALGWPAERTTLLPLAPRGSARAFYRIRHGRRSAILVRYSLDRPENALFVRNARFLELLGQRVPRILADWPEARSTVMEDLGDVSLLDRVRGAPSLPATDRLYRQVLAACVPLHTRGFAAARRARLPLSAPFDAALYAWEVDLFTEHYLRPVAGLPESEISLIRSELEQVSARLLREPPALVHRDLQSTNVHWVRGGPAFIDFQGMRSGPAVYDVASLLADPYVSLDEGVQRSLVRWYAVRLHRDPQEFEAAFWHAAVQRLAQALGAFGRLGARRETRRFVAHIAPGLAMLRRAVDHLDFLPALSRILPSNWQGNSRRQP